MQTVADRKENDGDGRLETLEVVKAQGKEIWDTSTIPHFYDPPAVNTDQAFQR
jgi:hypothetical protein